MLQPQPHHSAARFRSRTVTCLLLALGIPALLVSACIVLSEMTNRQQQADLNAILQPLGYTPQVELARGKTCWDMWVLQGSCGLMVHYTTDAPLDTFRQQVEALPLPIRTSRGSVIATLFNDVRRTGKRLLVDDQDPSEAEVVIPNLEGYRWVLTDPQGRTVFVYFYGTAQSQADYRLDGIPVQGNIVTVLLQTR